MAGATTIRRIIFTFAWMLNAGFTGGAGVAFVVAARNRADPFLCIPAALLFGFSACLLTAAWLTWSTKNDHRGG